MLERLVSKFSSTHPPHSSIRACARTLEGIVQREGRLVYNSSVWNAFTSLHPQHQGELDGTLAQMTNRLRPSQRVGQHFSQFDNRDAVELSSGVHSSTGDWSVSVADQRHFESSHDSKSPFLRGHAPSNDASERSTSSTGDHQRGDSTRVSTSAERTLTDTDSGSGSGSGSALSTRTSGVPYFADPPTVVSSQNLIDHPEFSCVIFRIPRGCVIPLHDHPDMHVLGKLLFGKLQVDAFDIAEDMASAPEVGTSHAIRSPTQIFSPQSQPSRPITEPNARNIHRFQALEDCALLELQFPPYSESDRRPCTYFDAFEVRPEHFELRPCSYDHPPDFHVVTHPD